MGLQLSYDDYFPHPPADKALGIGIVGSGSIVRGALAGLPQIRLPRGDVL